MAELLAPGCSMLLGPGTPHEAARPQLAALDLETMFAPHQVRDRAMGACCLAGLWLRHNFLDESHQVSQQVETTTGSYWHGLMHRREPDYGNAAYWFRRVGQHPIFEPLRQNAAVLPATTSKAAFLQTQCQWDPFRFIELCERAVCSGGALEALCQAVQECEWQLLFDFCYRRALGAAGA
jgi:hypothetical protein